MTVRIRVLGDIDVLVDDRAVDVGHARPRAVLAVLAAEANRVVAVDQLVDRVWGQANLPEDPRGALRTYISNLRRALAEVGEVALVRQSPGYKMVIDERRHVDLHQFGDLLAQARATGEDDEAAVLFEQALGLCRGEPFAGLDTAWSTAVRHSLHQQRQAAQLDLADIQLRRGRHAGLLAGLTSHAVEHPLDERITGQLMLALYRCGRQADALARYRRIREQLADELGVDPGPALQDLHMRILTNDPALASTPPDPATSQTPLVAVPRQLPAAPRLFSGRDRALAWLTETLAEQVGSGATLVISAIGGAGGIGKTWLALHWAHRHADRFSDGQLYANLRGFDPSGRPLSSQAAVRGFLHALGVESAAIPVEPDAQLGLYRSLLADKRMLIVLDNARDAAQVIPLLPGSPTCTVLVTSRRRLTGLIAAHGARTMDLDVLCEDEARHLMTRRLGQARASAEPHAVSALLACCGGLPLAISIVAARAGAQPTTPLSTIAEELIETSTRLDALSTGDPAANLRAALSWSYHALTPDAARALSLLALAPGPDIGAPAAASLLALPAANARVLLRELEDAYLIDCHGSYRYRMHDLVRLYATDRAERDHTPSEREAAQRRVLDFYTHTARSADHVLNPHRPPVALDPPMPGVRPRELPDDPAAMAWFEAEHANLLAAQNTAAACRWHPAVWHLAWALSGFHLRRGFRHEMLAAWQSALEAAKHLPDPATRARTHRALGRAYADLGRYEEGAEHLHHALALAEQHNDPAEQVQIHRQFSLAWGRRGDYRRALHHATRALELCRVLGQPVWEASALNSVGWHAAHLGDYDTARTHCRAALTVHHDHGNPQGEAETLDSLGYIEHHSGRDAQAVPLYQQAVALYHAVGDTSDCANTLDSLAHCHNALGQHRQARATWQQALELYRTHQRDTDAERVRQQLATLPAGDCPVNGVTGL